MAKSQYPDKEQESKTQSAACDEAARALQCRGTSDDLAPQALETIGTRHTPYPRGINV